MPPNDTDEVWDTFTCPDCAQDVIVLACAAPAANENGPRRCGVCAFLRAHVPAADQATMRKHLAP